ncbi:MAG: RidA family protein, partial [Pseudomonadota bacterium]
AGPFIRTAGMVGLDPAAGALVEGGAAAEFSQIMTTLFRIMDSNGLSLRNLFSATIYATDMGEFAAINGVWERFVPAEGPLPARTAIGVSALPLGAAVEAEFMFVKDQS